MRLSFRSGEHAIVTGAGLIGRQPLPDAGESFRHLLAIADPSRSMSKTHLEFGFDTDGLWIRDRWSSNGTTLLGPGQPELPLEAGRRYRAGAGSVVRLSTVEMLVEKAVASSTGV
ncbi:FHA domain-containing protein [Microbacteriaceae bacterium VKM Ac-2855]|nr:FHA domain-containing protein [Microbacteriaceae bacterium VKM Ac-2855]NQX11433.1 FHA domain-containing protein [Microbacteriaceae bacterium VKM Ac-2855]